MPKLTPPPLKLPKKIQEDPELYEFFKRLTTSIYQMFFAIGGNSKNNGIPTIDFRIEGDVGEGMARTVTLTGVADVPTTDPGWNTSSTIDMNTPDGYLKLYVGTKAVVVPYWK